MICVVSLGHNQDRWNAVGWRRRNVTVRMSKLGESIRETYFFTDIPVLTCFALNVLVK